MFSKMFKGSEQAQPEASQAKDQIKPNGMNPSDPAASGVADPNNPDAAKSPTNPLDAFKDLYKVDENKAGEEQASPHLQMTNEVLDKITPNINFLEGLSPEVQQGLSTGDPKSIIAAMQQVAANGYKTAMQHNATVMNQHLDQRFENYKPTIADSVDAKLTSQEVGKLPNADHPVIRAELDRVSKQLRQKFPSADNTWIAKQANSYLTDLGSQLSGTANAPQQQELPDTVDFAELLKQDN